MLVSVALPPRVPALGQGSPADCLSAPRQLWYIDGRMRVVITTANFFAHDWESIENVRIDGPLAPSLPRR
jgi:hypothetical protein